MQAECGQGAAQEFRVGQQIRRRRSDTAAHGVAREFQAIRKAARCKKVGRDYRERFRLFWIPSATALAASSTDGAPPNAGGTDGGTKGGACAIAGPLVLGPMMKYRSQPNGTKMITIIHTVRSSFGHVVMQRTMAISQKTKQTRLNPRMKSNGRRLNAMSQANAFAGLSIGEKAYANYTMLESPDSGPVAVELAHQFPVVYPPRARNLPP